MEKPKNKVREVFKKLPVLGEKYSKLETLSEKKKFVGNLKKGLEKQEKNKRTAEAVKSAIEKINKRVEKKDKLETIKNAKKEWKETKKIDEKKKLELAAKSLSKTMRTIISPAEAKRRLTKIPMEMPDRSIFMYDTSKSKEENMQDMLELYGKK